MAGTITLWDAYLPVKNFQLKKPADFMMLVLKDFPISSPGRFGISAYYMALFYWHYPFHFSLSYQPLSRYVHIKYLAPIDSGRIR